MQPIHSQRLEAASAGSAALLAGGSVAFTTGRGQQMLEQRLLEQQGKPGYTGMQNYEKIKAECLQKKALFVDTEFPATTESVYGNEEETKPITWMRASDIAKDPEFIVGGADRTDIMQGDLGDCWLLAAIASMTCFPQLLEKVVPMEQNFKTDYAGLFHFRLWHFGHWLDVVVDDLLPTYEGQLVFMHSRSANEFWSALLEKAYAKLYGSYAALKGGSIGEALEDFTGGINEKIDVSALDGDTDKLFNMLSKSFKKCSMMGCSINTDGREIEGKLDNGLIVGHAYSITAIRDLEMENHGHVQLLRIRNPWGESEWNGAWSDDADEWKQVSDDEKKKLGLQSDNDGEFWMSLSDFMQEYTTVEICHLGPDAMTEDTLDGQTRKNWEMLVEYGSWRRNVNAGGCPKYSDTFWTNPQFLIEITEVDEHLHPGQDPNTGTVIIGLMQKETRGHQEEEQDEEERIAVGFLIYDYDDKSKDLQNGLLTKRYIQTHRSVAKTDYSDDREVVQRFFLKPGKYTVVVSTFEQNEENDFMIRICSEKKQSFKENDSQTVMSDDHEHDAQKVVQIVDKDLDAIKELFKQFSGKDGEMTAYQLCDLLSKSKEYFKDVKDYSGFGRETCRSMVALTDCDCSGKLGFQEFLTLWKNLQFWKDNYVKWDSDKSGSFDATELRNALNSIGYVVSNKVFNTIVMRYVDQNNQIVFEDYMICVVRLKTVLRRTKLTRKSTTARRHSTLTNSFNSWCMCEFSRKCNKTKKFESEVQEALCFMLFFKQLSPAKNDCFIFAILNFLNRFSLIYE